MYEKEDEDGLISNLEPKSRKIYSFLFIIFTIFGSIVIIAGMIGLTISLYFLRQQNQIEELKLMIDGDDTLNYFYGNNQNNIHAVVSKNTTTPRLIYALPAGNEGVLIFFESQISTKYVFKHETFKPIQGGMENEIEIEDNLKITSILMGR